MINNLNRNAPHFCGALYHRPKGRCLTTQKIKTEEVQEQLLGAIDLLLEDHTNFKRRF